jgi:hypothetical protein
MRALKIPHVLTAAFCALGCVGQPEINSIDETPPGAGVAAPFYASCTVQTVVRPAANIDVAMVSGGGMVDAYRHILVLDCPDSWPTSMETQLFLQPLESNPLAQPLESKKSYTFLLDTRAPWQPEKPLLLEIRDGDQTLYRRPKPEGESETK